MNAEDVVLENAVYGCTGSARKLKLGRSTLGARARAQGQGKLVLVDKMSTLFSRCVHQNT